MTSNQIALWSYQESARHNLATEQENARHNVQTESLGWNQFWEQQRMNAFTKGMEQAKLAYNYDRLNADISIENAKMANQYEIAKLNAQSAANVATINAQVSRANAQLNAKTQERVAWMNNQSKLQTTKINATSNAAIKAADRINANHMNMANNATQIARQMMSNSNDRRLAQYNRSTSVWSQFAKFMSGGVVGRWVSQKP